MPASRTSSDPTGGTDAVAGVDNKAAEGGFDINAASSGLWVKGADHVGGHPKYNQTVIKALERIDVKLPPQDIAARVQTVVQKVRAGVEARKYGPWM